MPRLVDVAPLEFAKPPARAFVFVLRPYAVRIGAASVRVRECRVLAHDVIEHVHSLSGLGRERIDLALRLKIEFLSRRRPATMLFAIVND